MVLTVVKLFCSHTHCFDLVGLDAIGLCLKFFVLTKEEGGIWIEQRCIFFP